MRKGIPFADYVRPFALGVAMLAILGLLLGLRLGSLLPGASPAESSTLQSAATLTPTVILEDSLYLPYKAALYVMQKLDILSLTTVRAISAVMGALSAIAFYLILSKWHTKRVAAMGSFLFTTSSVFLVASRTGVPQACYLLLPVLFYLGIKLEEGTQRLSVAVMSVIVVTQLMYLPGMVWLLLGGLIWQRKRILARMREIHNAAIFLLILIAVGLLIPLGISISNNSDFILTWLAYPLEDQSLQVFVRNLVAVPWRIFVKQIFAPEFHVGRLPVIDVASSVFAALGAYWYFFQRKLDRAKLIAAGLVFGGILTAATSMHTQIIVMPFIYILVTGGITLLLQQWFTVFPRNPLARGIGLSIIIVLVGLISLFHLQRYFIAWPNTPETKNVYSIKSDTIEQ